MKRFKFSLESVLTLRRFHKVEAASVLGGCMRLRHQASDRLEAGLGRLKRIEDEFREVLSPGARASRIRMIQDALLEQRRAIGELEQAYRETLLKEERSREAVLKAQYEYEALVKLEERQKEQARKDADKEDDELMREYVSAHRIAFRGNRA